MTQRVLEPTDAAGVAAALQSAAAQNLAVTIRGGGTKALAPGEIVLSTTRLTAAVDHVAGDLVATAPAGATLEAVNNVLRREGQWLALDPPRAGRATIGGIVATNDSGPRRHRFGTPRDLIIGIEIALVNGHTAKAGGRVVKNVAGYDLSKLLCGSLGSLAVVTSATFKLSPVPPYSQTLVATVSDIRRLGELALAIADVPIAPTAIELQSPPHRLLIRFETTEQAARRQSELANAICVKHGATCAVVSGTAEADAWRAHEGRIFSTEGTILKLAILPTDVAEVLDRIRTSAAERRVEHEVIGRAALGIVLLRLAGDLGAQAAMVTELRLEATGRGGSAVLLSAPAGLLREVGRWGPASDADFADARGQAAVRSAEHPQSRRGCLGIMSAPSPSFASVAPLEPLIDKCVHCGFCLPTCPSYILLGQEMDSPRGRIYMMKAGVDGRAEINAGMVGHFDTCLGCMACETACPSGVRYAPLIEETRAAIEHHHQRPMGERIFRDLIFRLLPYPIGCGRWRGPSPSSTSCAGIRGCWRSCHSCCGISSPWRRTPAAPARPRRPRKRLPPWARHDCAWDS